MTQPIQHRFADLTGVHMHYVEAGTADGYPLVLLHGWPETWHAWRKVIPLLSQYRVIAPDLRGLGDSSRPASGYDKRTLAEDVSELLVDHLGVRDFFVVGHDMGGLVAYALAAARPDAASALVVLDVTVPQDLSELSQDGKRWHHGFHRTLDLPEALIRGREEVYLTWFFQNFSYQQDAIAPADIREYLRTYTQAGALRAGLEYYRTIPGDCDDIQKHLSAATLDSPVLALGGAEAWGRGEEPLHSLRKVARNVEGGALPKCGHFIPEEQPVVLAQRLTEFFDEIRAGGERA